METFDFPRVTSAERLNGGVLISFEDGKVAVFSAALLYASLPQAQPVEESSEDDT